jgi:hypothetical protein
MKTMKIIGKAIPLFVTCMFLMQACQKDHLKPTNSNEDYGAKSMNKEIPIVESSELVDTNDNQVKSFLNSEAILNGGFNFKNALFFKIKFKGLDTYSGIHIKFSDIDSTSIDLFHVEESGKNTQLTVIREKVGFKSQNIGRIIFKDINGKEYSNDYFDHQKIIQSKSVLFKKQPVYLDSSLQYRLKSNVTWSCTSAQFNSYYQEAKNNCAEDWLCDFACTFNPCAISYVAYAVGRCSGVFK